MGKKTISAYWIIAAGVVLFVAGLYFIKTIEDPQGMLLALPYIFVGLGCGIFGHGMGEAVIRKAKKIDPAAAKQLEIDMKDERNTAITNRAKATAYDRMVFVLGALITALALMALDVTVVLLLVFAYLFIIGTNTYYRIKYSKEM